MATCCNLVVLGFYLIHFCIGVLYIFVLGFYTCLYVWVLYMFVLGFYLIHFCIGVLYMFVLGFIHVCIGVLYMFVLGFYTCLYWGFRTISTVVCFIFHFIYRPMEMSSKKPVNHSKGGIQVKKKVKYFM